MVCLLPFEIPPFLLFLIKAYHYFGCALAFSIYSVRRKEWTLIYFGILVFSWSGSYPVTTMQRMTCTGKGCDGFLKMCPAYSYFCNTPRCPNRNVFCKPQGLLIILLRVYLPVSETFKYNMDSNLPGILVVPYEKYNLISCIFEHVLHFFCFLKEC